MKLLEFFSKNTAEDDKEQQMDQDLEKDLMGFILDDDDLYKEHILPIVKQIAKGKKPEAKEFLQVVNDGCLKFYKEQDMKKDPNEIFPIKMRKKLAQHLLTINTKRKKKEDQDENQRLDH